MNEKNNKGIAYAGTGERALGWLKRNSGILALLLVEIVFLSLVSDVFLTKTNIINVVRQCSTTMYMGCAVTCVMIIGGIDLSVGSIMAISAVGATLLSEAGMPFAVCLLAGLAIGAGIGVINGSIMAYTALPPFIVTYALQSIFRGFTYIITGGQAIRITNEGYLNMGSGFIGFLPLPVIYLLICVLVTWYVLNQSKTGRHMFAIGGNIKAAEFAGINIKKIKIFVYAFSGLMAALAGMVMASRAVSGQPTLGQGAEMDAVAAVVLGGTSMAGGKGSIGGTVIGALIIALINNGLNLLGVDGYWQYVAKGLVIIVAVWIDMSRASRMQKAA